MANVANGGDEAGDQPRVITLPPGRYVVASVYGASYRRVQGEVRAGIRTDT